MKFLIYSVVILFFVFVAVCVRIEKDIVLVPSKGYLHAPDGEFRFKEGDKKLGERFSGSLTHWED